MAAKPPPPVNGSSAPSSSGLARFQKNPAPVTSQVAGGSNRISSHLFPPQVQPQQPPPVYKTADSHSFSDILAAGATKQYTIGGIGYYFLLLANASTSGLLVRVFAGGLPSSQLVNFQGTGIIFGKITFDRFEIMNPGIAQVTFQLDVLGGTPGGGNDTRLDNRANPTQTGSNGAGNTIVVPDQITAVSFTTRSAGWANTLAGGASQVITENFNNRQRAYLLISNLDPNNVGSVLQLLDSAGNIVMSIQPNVTYQLPLNGTYTLKNATAAAISCNIGEGYYL